MPKRYLKTSFNAGEFTPQMYGRYDFSKYKNGCKTLYNAVCLPHGGATRRPGTKYIAEVANSNYRTRLIPFKFSETQSYILEFGHETIKIYYQDSVISTPDSNTKLLLHLDGNLTDYGDTSHTVTASPVSWLWDATYKFPTQCMHFELGVQNYLSVADHADWNFGTGAWCIDFWYRGYGSGTSADMCFWCQSTDQNNYHKLWYDYSEEKIFYTVCASGSPTNVLEYSITPANLNYANGFIHIAVIDNWGGVSTSQALCINGVAEDTTSSSTITIPDYTGAFLIGKGEDGAGGSTYLRGFIDEFRVTKGASRWTSAFDPPTEPYPFNDTGGGYGAALTVTSPYSASDVFDLQFAQSADVMYITHADYVTKKLSRTDHDTWTLATVSFTNAPAAWGANDYPYTVCFFQDRLCFGGNPSNPDTIWMSNVGDYEVFTVSGTPADDETVIYTLGSREVNRITWMVGGRRLRVGTLSGEWWLSGSTDQTPITPSANQGAEDTAWGSMPVKPIKAGNSVFFVQRLSSKLREQSYNWQADKYEATDASILAEHFFRGHLIYQMDYQEIPYGIIWMIREDGEALGFTYMREHEVFGWHEHVTDGEFESVAVIPGPDEDAVYFIVKRTINGSDVRYIEKLMPFDYGSSLYDAFFVDCGLSFIYDLGGTGKATVSQDGLDHLEGETLDLLTDGVVATDAAVSSGTVSLVAGGDSASNRLVAGLNYVSDIETLDPVIEDDEGFLQGLPKRIVSVCLNLYKTVHGYFGPDSSNLIAIKDTTGNSEYTNWTSDLSFHEGDDKTATVYLRQNEPIPFTVLAINHEFEED